MVDLIDECGKDLSLNKFKVKRDKRYGIEEVLLDIETRSDEKNTGFDRGNYVILSSPLTHFLDKECHDYISKILKKNLMRMMQNQNLKKGQLVLIVGLGNPEILADSLGIKVLEKIETNPFSEDNKVYKFSPNVFLMTGIDSFDMVHMLAVWLGVDYVILIDSLATTNISRLGVSIQLNSVGITPGSALNHKGKKISKESLGIPCFGIGVPLMFIVDKAIDGCPKNTILTPKDVHENINNLAYIISKAITACI